MLVNLTPGIYSTLSLYLLKQLRYTNINCSNWKLKHKKIAKFKKRRRQCSWFCSSKTLGINSAIFRLLKELKEWILLSIKSRGPNPEQGIQRIKNPEHWIQRTEIKSTESRRPKSRTMNMKHWKAPTFFLNLCVYATSFLNICSSILTN